MNPLPVSAGEVFILRDKKKEASSNNRSVMPLDILGCTRATMKVLESPSFTFSGWPLVQKGNLMH